MSAGFYTQFDLVVPASGAIEFPFHGRRESRAW
jgi:hypothetical protein